MREIKFRAWDKTYKIMNYKVQVGNTDYTDKNYTCNSIWVDYGDRKSIGWMNADDACIDLMQYTGLKDKNGIEIYENDIIKTTRGDWGVIIYKAPFFEVTVSENKSCTYSRQWFSEIEVIGNIYQNPELL